METAPLSFTRKPLARVVQRRVTGHDFNVFHAIVGSAPILEPRAAERVAAEEMSTPPMSLVEHEQDAAHGGRPSHQPMALAVASQVRQFYRRRVERTLVGGSGRGDWTGWIRRISDEALRRLDEASARLASSQRPRGTISPERRPSRRAA